MFLYHLAMTLSMLNIKVVDNDSSFCNNLPYCEYIEQVTRLALRTSMHFYLYMRLISCTQTKYNLHKSKRT